MDKLLNKIHHMDAMDLLAQIPDSSIDMVLTDPPYGINRDKGMGKGGIGLVARHQNVRTYEHEWDSERPEKLVFDEIIRVSKNAVIFGGNYFSDLLPQSNHWIVWDKLVTMPSYSKCELIWTNFEKNTVQKVERLMNGMIGGIRDRVHPTQKPVDLIVQLLCEYSKPNAIICDPFSGSGTTAIACRKTNRQFICGDYHLPYVEIARTRLQNTDPYRATVNKDGSKQLSLFEDSE